MLHGCSYLCFSLLFVAIFLPSDVDGLFKCGKTKRKGCKGSLKKGPVCGTDGVTYPDECTLVKESCATDNDQLTKDYKGKCVATTPVPMTSTPATTPSGHVCDTDPCQNKGLCLPIGYEMGEYECLCQDGFAGTTCGIGKPAPPVSVTAKTVPADSRTILVEWIQPTAKRASQPDGYILEQKLNTKAYQRVTAAIYGDARKYEVNSLQPGSVYRFRLIAVNIAGNSRPSDDSNNITLPEMPPSSPPREVSARAKSATKLRVRWKKPYREDLNGVLLGYQVIYRVANDMQNVEVLDPEVTYLDLVNLKPDTRYTVYTVAFNAAGRSPVGEGVTARTFKKGIKHTPTTQQPTTSSVISGCLSNPCQNGGTCISFPSESIPGLFTCVCKPDFMGKECSHSSVPACFSWPCLNGGVCISDGEDGYTCRCTEYFTGTNCQQRVQIPCSSSPCLKGEVYQFRVIGPCQKMNRCENGGTCVEVNAKVYKCNCPSGYKGYNCQLSEEYLPSFSSSDGSSDVQLCILECGEHGICWGSPFQRELHCECDDGYTGDLCEFEIGPDENSASSIVITSACLSSPCAFGTCLDEENGSFKCLCGTGYTGSRCDVEITTESWSASEPDLGPCEVNPCQNGGECISEQIQIESSSSLDSYVCSCLDGFTGHDCETTNPVLTTESSSASEPDLGPCAVNPCQNGGECISEHIQNESSSSLDIYVYCSCPDGFKGHYCDTIEPTVQPDHSSLSTSDTESPCAKDPCLNGGLCTALAASSGDSESASFSFEEDYICTCRLGFVGINCEKTAPKNCIVPVLQHGIVKGSSNHGGIILYECIDGFTLVGNDSRECVDGVYDGDQPICKPDCSSIQFQNGFISGSLKHGTEVEFSCDDGFELVGPQFVSCFDGSFDPSAPSCQCTTSHIAPLAEFNSNIYGIKGSFSRSDDGNIVIDGFSYDGIPTDVYFVAGAGNIPTADGEILAYFFNGTFVKNSLGRKYSNEMMLLQEPDFTVIWIAVASPVIDTIYSVAFFPVEEMSSSDYGSSHVDLCASQPCQNGALCSHGFEESTYVCYCSDEYMGVNCEIDLTPCVPSPCFNGASCTVLSEPEPSSKRFKCNCKERFTGELCDEGMFIL